MTYAKETAVVLGLMLVGMGGCAYGVHSWLISDLCGRYECRGNAPGECPVPPMCPPR